MINLRRDENMITKHPPVSAKTKETHDKLADMIVSRDPTNPLKFIRDVTSFLQEQKGGSTKIS